MLNQVKTFTGAKLRCRDGDIGSVRDFYFDDRHWAIRYLAADTGHWLRERQVLIAPYALSAVVGDTSHIAVDLTMQQIEDSPSLEGDQLISRQFEKAYYGYYQWPSYWGGPHRWGYSSHIVNDREQWKSADTDGDEWDPHLRSTSDVRGYRIRAADDDIGRVDDFIIEDETWAIRYLVIDTGNWWSGKKVLVSPRWIERISWSESLVYLDLSPEAIKQSPEYTEASLVTRDYETRLYRHYERQGYWVEERDVAAHSR